MKRIPRELVKVLKSVTNKRARVVIDHILKHGHITSEELEKTYGYNHPPRAARDVREAGIPLETFRVKSSDGRSIAAYRFGNLSEIRRDRLAGRKVLPKTLKGRLYEDSGGRCYVCFGHFESRYLQVDHRIPYEVAGDVKKIGKGKSKYMLLCGSCNRAKSWSCEHCANWNSSKSRKVCAKCYWATPESYYHIALRPVRRADILWEEHEVEEYERLRRLSKKTSTPLSDFVKKAVGRFLAKGCN